jgi:hypothetical protein
VTFKEDIFPEWRKEITIQELTRENVELNKKVSELEETIKKLNQSRGSYRGWKKRRTK